MKAINKHKGTLGLITVCLLLGTPTNSISQTKSRETNTMKTITKKQSKEIVQDFFTAFGNGDIIGVLNCFHDSCTVIAVRDSQRNGDQIYGTYKGKDGVKTFLANLGSSFDTKAFTVENIVGEGDVSFANGKFTHVVKATGKSFPSDWALMCTVKDNKILEYHFYEDSEKFSESKR